MAQKSLILPFPVITFRENDWVIATTPVIDISAQGKTEEEALKYLEAMIEDYMGDPDTPKPTVQAVINMRIGIKSMPVKLVIQPERSFSDARKNTPLTA